MIDQYVRENTENWNRVGWNTIFKRCLDSKMFESPNMTNYESVFYQPFETVLTYFNIENAII